jgi:hypothetical protein
VKGGISKGSKRFQVSKGNSQTGEQRDKLGITNISGKVRVTHFLKGADRGES